MNTAQDLVAYLLAANGGGAQDGEHEAVRQAVIHGVREVIQCRDWQWYTRTSGFFTQKLATNGTTTANSEYVQVGDGSLFIPGRIVRVASSTFRDPVRVVSVDGNVVRFDQKAKGSATAVQMEPQQFYDLPVDCKNIDALTTNTVGTLHCYIPPMDWQRLEVNSNGAGEPYYYTVMRSDVNPDRMQIRFVGHPVDHVHVQFTYRVSPKPIKYMGYERLARTGTVQLHNVSNQMTVTGTKTNFPQDCAGAYIRFGSPGMPAEAHGSTNPFLFERRIEKWQTTSSLLVSDTTAYDRPGPDGIGEQAINFDAGHLNLQQVPEDYVDGNLNTTYSTSLWSQNDTPLPANTQYSITDVIDTSPTMWTAVLSAAEMWYARTAGKPSSTPLQTFNRDLRIAFENDDISPLKGRPPSGLHGTPRSFGWYSTQMPDIE